MLFPDSDSKHQRCVQVKRMRRINKSNLLPFHSVNLISIVKFGFRNFVDFPISLTHGLYEVNAILIRSDY